MVTGRISKRATSFRLGSADLALLSLVAGRMGRTRVDTMRMMIRAAAAELDESAANSAARGGER